MRPRSAYLSALLAAAALAAGTAVAAELPQPRRTTSLGGVLPSWASLLMVEAEGGDLTVATFATPLAAAPGATRTLVVVEVAGAGLLAELTGDEAVVELLVYAVRPDGEVVGSLLEGIRLDVAALGETLERGGLKLTAALDLPPGEVSLRALVHERASGAFGLGHVAFEVPAAHPEEPRMHGPVFGESSASWLPVEPGAARARAQPARLGPLLPGGDARVAGHPVLVAGRPSRASVLLVGFDDREVEVEGRLQTFDGGRPGRVRVDVVERLAAPQLGGELLGLRILVEETPTGHQQLRLTARGAAAEALVEAPPVRVLTLAQEVDVAEVAWPELGTLVHADKRLSLAELVPFDPALLDQGEPASIRRADIRDAYCAGLRQLSAGNRGVALASVQTLESEVMKHNPRLRSQRILAGVQSGFLLELIRREEQVALPILLLHLDLFEDYLRHDQALALHTQYLLRRLVATYLQIENDEERRRAAVQVLAIVAVLRLQESAISTAIALFEEALRHDPSNRLAGLALGAAFERLAENREAARILRKVVDEHPRSAEARLRLAVNLARIGRHREARFYLQQIVRRPGPAWVQAVAFQELARLLEGRGRDVEETIAVLEEGIRRFPTEQPLRLRLAQLEEQRGNRERADQLLEPLLETAESSPWHNSRHRYSQWPLEELWQERRRLREHALLQSPRLARLMEGGRGGTNGCPG